MHPPAGDNESQPDSANRGSDALLAQAAWFRAQPAFPHAVRAYTGGLAAFRDALRLANKLLSQETRFRTVRYLLYLDADRERYGANGGATYGRLLELCTLRNEVSPRVLKTMLALLTLTGFVETRRSESDRRLKFYHPTPRMMHFVRQRVGNAASALDILQPEMRRAQLLQDDPQFIRRLLASAGREHIKGLSPTEHMPEFISFFGGREGAAPLVFTVVLADIDRTPPPSRADIAGRFGLSKTQVSNIIAQGVQLGYFMLDGAAVPSATPLLRDQFDRWISIELAFHARHMGTVLGPAPLDHESHFRSDRIGTGL